MGEGRVSEAEEPISFRIDARLLHLIDEEAKQRHVNRSTIVREVLWASLDPEKRRGESYGHYLRARDVDKARAILASLTLLVFTLGGWTIGLLAVKGL